MADQKYTKKPCPACGKKPAYRRPADDVCSDCRGLIETGQALLKAQAVDKKLYRLPWAAHALPYFLECGEFRQAFKRALDAAGPVVPATAVVGDDSCPSERLDLEYETGWGSDVRAVQISPELAEALARVYTTAMEAVDSAYKEGRSDGEDLVKGLAEGRLSLNDLNRRTVKKS